MWVLVLSLIMGMLILVFFKYVRPNIGNLPYARGWVPLLGHAQKMRSLEMTDFVTTESRHFGSPFILQLMFRRIVVLPPCQRNLITHTNDNILSIEDVFEKVFGAKFFTRNSADSHFHVDVLRRDFVPKRKLFIQRFVDVSSKFFQSNFSPSCPTTVYDVLHFAQELVADAALSAMLVGSSTALRNALIELSVETEGVLRRSFVNIPEFLIRMQVKKKFPDIYARIDAEVLPIIAERRRGDTTEFDYLNMLLKAATSETSDEELVRYFESICNAAFQTTRNALVHAIYDLASRPNLQNEVFAEVHAVGVEDVEKLVLLEGCVRESQRFRVAGTLPVRKAMVDIPLTEHTWIPKGTFVAVAAQAVHLDEYENGLQFDPKRWLDSKLPCVTDNLSFGGGVHKCPGRFFALAEIKTLLAIVISKYKLSGGVQSPSRGDHWIKHDVTFHPRSTD